MAVLLAQHFQALLASAVRLQSLIFLDFLTGLYNRPYFEDQLEKQVAIAERRKQSLALCIVDIDGFKNFNTLYGYEGGDRVLVTVGCILKGILRTSDTLARYGGEEFAALLVPPVTRERAWGIAERLRAAVEAEPFQVQTDRRPPRSYGLGCGHCFRIMPQRPRAMDR
jgi:diguanylate cyclase (GGDEF)-like protein